MYLNYIFNAIKSNLYLNMISKNYLNYYIFNETKIGFI